MNLKDTLNLPKTKFPMRADLVNREPERLKKWMEDDVYGAIQEKNKDGTPFILHDGPPFTNGDVHIGTALNKILKDIIVRYKSMQGFRTPYVPGWDCHGLPIELKVVKSLREKNKPFDAVILRKACAQFSRDFIQKQRAQFQRLGILADWEHDYRTMDPGYEATVLRFFADCIHRGLVYRSKKPVYWSIPCKTALAEAEVEYKEHISPSIWVKFRCDEDACKVLKMTLPTYVVIWTTTPWTLPANQAIAIHPLLDYVIINVGEENFLIGKDRLEDFVSQCSIENFQVIAEFKGQALEGLATHHPFINRESKIVLANYVTTEAGTGCVHTAPGHGLDDYNTGLAYHLDIYCPLDDNGCYVDDGQVPAALVGVSVFDDHGKCDANDKVLAMLSESHALLGKKLYKHAYPHCWRSKSPVIFRAMSQWFIDLNKDHVRESALAAIDQVKWVPGWGENRFRAAVSSRTDWCISRQRAWGTPLPVFYDRETQEPILNEEIVRGIADKFEQHGSDYWFQATEEALLEGVPLPEGISPKQLVKGTDTLDVWIDSGNSHQAVLKKHPDLQWPADVYLEGTDQHRGWFQSSLLTSVISQNGQPPFKTVLTHGFMVGEDGKKISKSDGKPQSADDYIKKFGVDILRLWFASEDFRSDITVSDDIIGHVTGTYRGIRNTLRFQIGNLYDFEWAKDAVAFDQMTLIDRWILQKTRRLIKEVTEAYEGYELHKVYQLINRFCSVELSAIYHDILKDRLYTFPASSLERRSSQTAIYSILKTLLSIMTPILTFTCDEALAYWTCDQDYGPQHAQLLAWPKVEEWPEFSQEEAIFDRLIAFRMKVNEELEKARQSKFIGQSLDAKVVIECPASEDIYGILSKNIDLLPEIFIVSQVELNATETDSIKIAVRLAEGVRCPRSWKWVDHLVDAGEFGQVSEKCYEALLEKFPTIKERK